MVEYAPCQKYPKRKPHEDKLEGTITKDGDYLKFLEVLAAPPAPPVVPTETAPVERKITDIPLLMELIEKKRKIQLAAKARAERGMRSDKMNKSRRDELRRGKDDGKAPPRNSNSKKPLPRPSDDGHSGKASDGRERPRERLPARCEASTDDFNCKETPLSCYPTDKEKAGGSARVRWIACTSTQTQTSREERERSSETKRQRQEGKGNRQRWSGIEATPTQVSKFSLVGGCGWC